MRRPLSGVRVVDLTIVVAGPVGTALLADLGAEVIKVENTVQRQIIGVAPPKREPGEPPRPVRAASFSDLNRGKKGITLNLNLPEARDVLLRLVAVSDVVIDNFSPRVMRNFALEYEDLVRVKPDIIAVSMPAFGRTGPFRDRTSFGPGIDALSGLCHLTGYPDSTPLKPGNYYCDYNAGVLAATAVMAALHHRRRTGKGQFIELAMRDGETQLIGEFVLDYLLNGRVQERSANAHPAMAPHNVYPCSQPDRWVAIEVGSDAEWTALCRAMGREELASDPRFATALARKANEAEVDRAVAAWTRTKGHIEAMRLLQTAGVAAGAVLTTGDIASDPQYRHRGAFLQVDMENGETAELMRVSWLSRRYEMDVRRAPDFSEHTREVLQGFLNLSDREVADLAARGAIVLPEAME
jgi:benzylsuccinate CoA-transferase BbsF subunit